MKRSIYLAVLTLVTCVCMVLGLIIHEGGNSGFSWHMFSFSNDREEKKETTAAFDKIDIQTQTADITIKQGSEYSVAMTSYGNRKLTSSVRNNTITIHQQKGFATWFSFGFMSSTHVTVTVPKGVELQSIKSSSNVGDVRIEGISTKEITGSVDTGDVNISNAKLGSTSLESDTGDLTLRSVDIADAKLSTDTGDIHMDCIGASNNYSLNLGTDVGDVTVDGKEEGRKLQIDAQKGYNLEMDTDVGDITLNFAD